MGEIIQTIAVYGVDAAAGPAISNAELGDDQRIGRLTLTVDDESAPARRESTAPACSRCETTLPGVAAPGCSSRQITQGNVGVGNPRV
jgi:hypothetical protein